MNDFLLLCAGALLFTGCYSSDTVSDAGMQDASSPPRDSGGRRDTGVRRTDGGPPPVDAPPGDAGAFVDVILRGEIDGLDSRTVWARTDEPFLSNEWQMVHIVGGRFEFTFVRVLDYRDRFGVYLVGFIDTDDGVCDDDTDRPFRIFASNTFDGNPIEVSYADREDDVVCEMVESD